MPVHDWTRVKPGIFHDFHHEWISCIRRALNDGRMPPAYYALAEQVTGVFGPDVLALQTPAADGAPTPEESQGTLLTAVVPRTRFKVDAAEDEYAATAEQVTIRHVTGHELIAVVEIVSPGNKDTAGKLRTFADKARTLLANEIHLTIIDLFPPTPRDPRGVHPVVWEPLVSDRDPYTPPPGEPLTLVSYIAPPAPKAFLEPVAVGAVLIDMPVFLTRERYIDLPLEATYLQAWEAVPKFWKAVVAG